MNSQINEQVIQRVLGASTRANYFVQQLNIRENPYQILDILLVAILAYWVYLLLKETRAIRILIGIAVLLAVMLVARLLQLQTLNYILGYVLAGMVVAIPIIFQPELRAALERLGRPRFVGDFAHLKKGKIEEVAKEIVGAAEYFSKEKIGAIMVITRQTGLRDIVQTGVRLDGYVSKQLLINIFADKTPLHDGAVIISGDRIVAANCWLPLTEQEFNFDLGTRHRAAAGITVDTDAVVVVVSEETGKISLAVGGNLTVDLTAAQLWDFLAKLFQHKIEGVISGQKN